MSRLLVLLNVLTVALLCLLTVGMLGCGGGLHGENRGGTRLAAPAAPVAVHNDAGPSARPAPVAALVPVEAVLVTAEARQFLGWMGLVR